MKSREYGTWPPRNGLNPERQKLYDPYNRALKGEPYLHVDEYAGMDVEEYYRVPAQKDVSGNPYEQNRESMSGQSKKPDNAKQMRRMNMIRQVAFMVAGSVIITTSYTAAIQRQQEPKPDLPPASVEPAEPDTSTPDLPIVSEPVSDEPVSDEPVSDEPTESVASVEPAEPDTSTPDLPIVSEPVSDEPVSEEPTDVRQTWQWSDDHRSATLVITDAQGVVLAEIPAAVNVVSLPPTCNTDGTVTYTATAEQDGERYSDAYGETKPALGHAFDQGEEIVLENGHTAMHFECSRCHEEFIIENQMTEND